jgi:hypothetical protein
LFISPTSSRTWGYFYLILNTKKSSALKKIDSKDALLDFSEITDLVN